jgi:hypothetical protein
MGRPLTDNAQHQPVRQQQLLTPGIGPLSAKLS